MSRVELDEQRMRAARLAGCVDMLDARLMRGEFELDSFPDPDAKLSWSLDIRPSATTPAPDVSDGRFVVTCEFTLKVSQDAGSGANDIFSLECDYSALYSIQGGHRDGKPFTKAEVDAFAASTGAFALYPYARAFIQDTTARVGLPPLTLGVYRSPIEDPTKPAKASKPKQRQTRTAVAKKTKSATRSE